MDQGAHPFVRIVLKMLEKRDTRVVYVRGNHDDVSGCFCPWSLKAFAWWKITFTKGGGATSCCTATYSIR